MIRGSILCLSCLFCIVNFSGAIDDTKTIPVCEDKLPHEIYFDLSNMGLTSIRKSFVSGPSVACVNLAKNQILTLEQGAFDGLPELKYLNLAENPVSFQDFMQLSLPELKTLVLDGPFSEWSDNHNPYNWYASDPRWSQISPIILPNLEKLSVRNFLDQGVSTWLQYFMVPNLTHLYLSGNNFRDGNLGAIFTSTLTHLNMDNNQVRMFMTNFPQLRYLSMDGNQIRNLCNAYCNSESLSLRDFINLEYLSLMNNKILVIESNAFEDSSKLSVLNLAGNEIMNLPRHLFDNMTNLKNLALSNNALREIPEICGLKELEVLELNGNKILSINDASFCNLSHLHSIDLSSNGLTSILDGTFGELAGLATLDLSWNKIETLPENWMGLGPVLLNSLNLHGNSFNDVANMSLGLFVELDKISIGQNPLRMVTIRSLMTLPQDMKIDVSRVYDLEPKNN